MGGRLPKPTIIVAYSPIDYFISITLALIMLGVGMSITFDDFRAVVRRPRSFSIGLSAQMLALPAFAFALALLAPVSPEVKVGIVILALCPGGNTSNYISYLVNGNVALSISLTAVNGVLSLASIPIVVNQALLLFVGRGREIHLPVGLTILQILLVTIIPAFLGVLIRQVYPLFTERVQRPVRIITSVLLALAFVVLFFGSDSQGGVGFDFPADLAILPYVLLLNFAGLALGYFGGVAAKLSKRNAVTLAIEIGLQNTTLAILIASALLNSPAMAKPALIYALFSFWTTLGFAFYARKRYSFQ